LRAVLRHMTHLTAAKPKFGEQVGHQQGSQRQGHRERGIHHEAGV
jgi:hypothetical protein